MTTKYVEIKGYLNLFLSNIYQSCLHFYKVLLPNGIEDMYVYTCTTVALNQAVLADSVITSVDTTKL